MLAQKRISQKQLVVYLSIVSAIIIVIVLIIFRKSLFGPGPAGSAGGSQDGAATGIAAIIKTRFDITKLRVFDVEFFADPRLKNLFEPSLEQRSKPSVGKKNPFEPRNASSTSQKK